MILLICMKLKLVMFAYNF